MNKSLISMAESQKKLLGVAMSSNSSNKYNDVTLGESHYLLKMFNEIISCNEKKVLSMWGELNEHCLEKLGNKFNDRLISYYSSRDMI